MSRTATQAIAACCTILACVSAAAAQQEPPTRAQSYRLELVKGDVKDLRARFDPGQIEVLEALNRADAGHLAALKEIVVPDSWHDDLLLYSPFPRRLEVWGADRDRLLIVNQPGQAFAAYENGQLVRWGPVSTGRALSPTPQGLFHLNWRSPGRHSTVNPRWFMRWYFNFQNQRGLSFHEYDLPGRPASHACVRLLGRDARWLYEWGEGWMLDDRGWEVLKHGTPVLISGCYAFGDAPPWRSPAWLTGGITVPANPSLPERSCSGE